VGAFVFRVEPEINIVILYGKTLAQSLGRRTGKYFLEPVLGLVDELFFDLIHIYSIGIFFPNIKG
jgi:hypothetical protein